MTVTIVLDKISDSQIHGWGWDSENPDHAITVALNYGGKIVAQVRANHRRVDVMAAGFGSGNYGFNIPFPLLSYDTIQEFSVTAPGSEASIILANGLDNISSAIFDEVRRCLCEELKPALMHTDRELAISIVQPSRDINFNVFIDGVHTSFTWGPTVVHNEQKLIVAVPRQFADGLQHRIELFIGGHDGGIQLARFNEPIAVYKPALRGYLDGLQGAAIVGWCADDADLSNAVSIEIYIDNNLAQIETANLFRSDLISAVPGGTAGFSWTIPPHLRDGRRHKVDAIPSSTFQPLPSKSLDITFPSLAPPTLYQFGSTRIDFSFCPQSFAIIPEEAAISLATFNSSSETIASARHLVHALKSQPKVTVVVPIYNAFREVERCLGSLICNTTYACDFLLIDDASPDREISLLLERYENLPSVRILRNEGNIGYTRTCNRAVTETSGDLVFLNSDTYVPPRWLERLVIAAYRAPDTATVTALSDNSGAFSVPLPGSANLRPTRITPDAYANLMSRASGANTPSVPTGNGFCMYVRRATINEIGNFDEEAFPRGYGEENDFCMRALKAGWKNIIDDRSFVFHVRSASFAGEKHELYDNAQTVLRSQHPEYTVMTSTFARDPRIEDMRSRAQSIATWLTRPGSERMGERIGRPRLLYTLHFTGEGGTALTTRDLVGQVSDVFECFLLTTENNELGLDYWIHGDWKRLATVTLDGPMDVLDAPRPDYEAAVISLLVEYDIALVHIRHLIGHSLLLPRTISRINIPVVMSFHDYYMLCPSVNLLDNKNNYCDAQCTPGHGDCRSAVDLPLEYGPLKHGYVHAWRDRIRKVLPFCNTLVTTSPYVHDLFCRVYPELRDGRFRVIEHGRDNTPAQSIAAPPQSGGPIKILILGNVAPKYKGFEVVQAIKRLDAEDEIEFHFLGHAPPEAAKFGIVHGRYERDKLAECVAAIRPAFVGIFSIWAETYCHTLSEAWQMGIPVVGSELGAVGERISEYGGGWSVDCTRPGDLLNLVRRLRDTPYEWEEQRRRAHAGNIRSTAAMACDYIEIYKRAILPPVVRSRGILRVVVVGQSSSSEWWSNSGRVMSLLKHPSVCRQLNVIFTELTELQRSRYSPPIDGQILMVIADDCLPIEDVLLAERTALEHGMVAVRISRPALLGLRDFVDERVWLRPEQVTGREPVLRVGGMEVKRAVAIITQIHPDPNDQPAALVNVLQATGVAHMVPVLLTSAESVLPGINRIIHLQSDPAFLARQLHVVCDGTALVLIPPPDADHPFVISERELGMMGVCTLELQWKGLNVEHAATQIAERLSTNRIDRTSIALEAERQFGIHANAEKIIQILRQTTMAHGVPTLLTDVSQSPPLSDVLQSRPNVRGTRRRQTLVRVGALSA